MYTIVSVRLTRVKRGFLRNNIPISYMLLVLLALIHGLSADTFQMNPFSQFPEEMNLPRDKILSIHRL